MYSFTGDREKHRVKIAFSGQYVGEHDRFDALLQETVCKVRAPSGQFDCLIDMIDAPVAPQEIASRGGDAIQWAIKHGMRKAAFATGTVTGRMQMRRLSEQSERVEYFSTLEEALHWLDLEPIDPRTS